MPEIPEEPDGPKVPEEPTVEEHAVGFSAQLAGDNGQAAGARRTAATRSAGDPLPGDGELTTELLRQVGFGVYCWYTGTSTYTSGHIKDCAQYELMQNQRVYDSTPSAEDPNWTYSPSKYWPLAENEKLTLRAYAPYVSYQLQTDANGLPQLPVAITENDYHSGKQHDPLWGTSKYVGPETRYGELYDNYTFVMSGDALGADSGDGTINWYFHHGMTRLIFMLSVIGDAGCDRVTITGITIKPLYDKGLLDLSSESTSSSTKPTWTDRAPADPDGMTVELEEGDTDPPSEATSDLAPVPAALSGNAEQAAYPFTIKVGNQDTEYIELLRKGLLIIPRDYSSTPMDISISYYIDGDKAHPSTAKGTITQNFEGNTSYELKLLLSPKTNGLEITLVQSAFTPWTQGGTGSHEVYNW